MYVWTIRWEFSTLKLNWMSAFGVEGGGGGGGGDAPTLRVLREIDDFSKRNHSYCDTMRKQNRTCVHVARSKEEGGPNHKKMMDKEMMRSIYIKSSRKLWLFTRFLLKYSSISTFKFHLNLARAFALTIASFTCNISIRMRAVSIAICLHCEDHYVSLQLHLTSHLFHFILNSFF